MIETPNMKEILDRNPSISAKQLREIDDLTRELRRIGLKPRGYRLPAPHERRQARSGFADASDSRNVRVDESHGP
jgi:hypothetical protein